MFGTNPYPTKQIKGNFIIFKSADWEGKCWFAGGYVGISGDGGEEKKGNSVCGCNLVCLFILTPDLLQVDVESRTKVREEREIIRTTLEGTKATCQQ